MPCDESFLHFVAEYRACDRLHYARYAGVESNAYELSSEHHFSQLDYANAGCRQVVAAIRIELFWLISFMRRYLRRLDKLELTLGTHDRNIFISPRDFAGNRCASARSASSGLIERAHG